VNVYAKHIFEAFYSDLKLGIALGSVPLQGSFLSFFHSTLLN